MDQLSFFLINQKSRLTVKINDKKIISTEASRIFQPSFRGVKLPKICIGKNIFVDSRKESILLYKNQNLFSEAIFKFLMQFFSTSKNCWAM